MLVLARKQGEKLLLLVEGREIEISINEIRSHKAKAVRIGIEAPKDVMILRPELLEQERQIREGARQLFGESK